MKIMVLILAMAIASLAMDCPWRFVYENDGALAQHQDSLLAQYQRGDSLPKRDIRTLKINWWVKTAYKLAPGNLVIRQYCIIDVYENEASHKEEIQRLVNILSGESGGYRSWAEGYSYWLYTKAALNPWLDKFKDDSLLNMRKAIDLGFAITAWRQWGQWKPAPFGDLYDVPLDSMGQKLAYDSCMQYERIYVKNITRSVIDGYITYDIDPMPVGLNGHCEKSRGSYKIDDNKPQGFKYYTGYQEKFESRKAEWTDLLDPRRIFTIPFIW